MIILVTIKYEKPLLQLTLPYSIFLCVPEFLLCFFFPLHNNQGFVAIPSFWGRFT